MRNTFNVTLEESNHTRPTSWSCKASCATSAREPSLPTAARTQRGSWSLRRVRFEKNRHLDFRRRSSRDQPNLCHQSSRDHPASFEPSTSTCTHIQTTDINITIKFARKIVVHCTSPSPSANHVSSIHKLNITLPFKI